METLQKYSEQELVTLLRQRREEAFGYLYDHYSGSLLSVIQGVVSDEIMANDVLQEVFVKIWKQIDSYDASKGRLFTWMLNISRNAAIDCVRSKGYRNHHFTGELTETISENAGTVTIEKAEYIGLRKMVHTLKQEQKILIELSYFEGYTQEEISKMLGIPLGTIKTRLRAALIQLRQVIQR